jgi:putative alpha-1,2-mannosidase
VTGGTDSQRKIFYTGVYHTFIAPNLYMDVNGDYVAAQENMNTKWFTNYSTILTGTDSEQPSFDHYGSETYQRICQFLISRYTDRKDHMPIWELCGYDNFCMLAITVYR